ncbi:hypothetical protein DBB30_09050 [Yersinia pestis]|nr:hypothetical protein EGX42_01865 [Yersinia pestis]AYX19019.1 hypothetical protein EGX46_06265 [Yersinia pestis]AYX24522.1 hypothetical protein EGX74_12440 [Yersinia pestis]PRH52449.1 hypothetical protein C6P85_15895 [Yersinia pestis]PRH54533.1 hypothetical protein C6P90_15325 [Yersinia pestis]
MIYLPYCKLHVRWPPSCNLNYLGYKCANLEFQTRKNPVSLEPKKAGLPGSSIWGHQRKAVALIQTPA